MSSKNCVEGWGRQEKERGRGDASSPLHWYQIAVAQHWHCYSSARATGGLPSDYKSNTRVCPRKNGTLALVKCPSNLAAQLSMAPLQLWKEHSDSRDEGAMDAGSGAPKATAEVSGLFDCHRQAWTTAGPC